ncbi:MAG: hypothetical protein Q4E89_12815 [Eubacteriales bacterium]|nr:hypothetical protein [Eubacteriales bacterium]
MTAQTSAAMYEVGEQAAADNPALYPVLEETLYKNQRNIRFVCK